MKNKSDVQNMLKEAGILLAITLIAGLLLGVVYELTKEPIAIQQEKAVQEACEAAFPVSEHDRPAVAEDSPRFLFTPCEDIFKDYELDAALASELAAEGIEIGTIYLVADNYDPARNLVTYCGCVAEVRSKNGYGGDIVLYVGVDYDGMVRGVSITELSETAGLGMEAPKVLAPQFAGKTVESFSYTKTGAVADNEVDAISGATVTTSAVVNAVNGGIRAIQSFRGTAGDNQMTAGGGGNE